MKRQETPDAWIERLPEDAGPQEEDACMVCRKIDCECPPEDAILDTLIEDLRTEGRLIPFQLHDGLRSLTEGFGLDFDERNRNAADFLERYKNERIPE